MINIITRGTAGQSKHVLNGSAGSNDYQNVNGSSSFDINQQQHLKVAGGYESEDGYNVHPVAGINDSDKHGFLAVMPFFLLIIRINGSITRMFIVRCTGREMPFRAMVLVHIIKHMNVMKPGKKILTTS